MRSPDVSVVIPTYNRAALLRRTLESVLREDANDISFEVIVVDNNCTDDTAAVVSSLQLRPGPRLHYVKETQQGNAHARNAGIWHARAPIIAFTDDDVCVSPGWVKGVVDAFTTYPTASFLGGPVLPLWKDGPPSWLTRESWAPLAAVEYGPVPFEISGTDPLCLLGANFAIRRDALERVGTFLPSLQRVKDGIGSLEDHELIVRLCRAGERGMYLPALTTFTPIDRERLSKRYHRRWHRGQGRFYAILRDREFERSRTTLFGVPGHVYRQALISAFGWLGATVRGKSDKAFHFESQFWFSLGFLAQRMYRH